MPFFDSWDATKCGRQTGKLCVITGANSGIGLETAKAMGGLGASVVMACRSAERAGRAREELLRAVPGGSFEVLPLDLSSFESVRTFAATMRARGDPVDYLINNAGVMTIPQYTTTAVQGPAKKPYEMQFAANHLGHFLLVSEMLPLLAKAPQPRLVIVSSSAARLQVGWTESSVPDFTQSKEAYDKVATYGNSKVCGLLLMHELRRRYPELFVVASHPGWTQTNLQTGSDYESVNCLGMPGWKGALPTLRAATDPAAQPGTMYGPSMGLWGYPEVTTAFNTDLGKSPRLAAVVWAASVEATGAQYPNSWAKQDSLL